MSSSDDKRARFDEAALQPGHVVLYSPSPGHHFLGVVAGPVRNLGDTAVVRLERMEVGYAGGVCKPAGTASVAAAAVERIKVVGALPDLYQWSQCMTDFERPAAKVGDYVLATKYADGDPCDQFSVGWVSAEGPHDRMIVVDEEGQPFRANGFRRVEPITDAEGRALVELSDTIGDVPGPSVWFHLAQIRRRLASPVELRHVEPRQIPGSVIAEASTVAEAAFACPSCGVGSIMVKLEQPGRVDVLKGTGIKCDRCDKTVSVELRRSPQ